tara:strand:- start:390 stop:821 length:432 start_codon:yes stop_codon:yes gene_type:complete
MADTREPSPRSRRTKQGSEIPSKKTQAEIDAAKEGAKKARKIIEEGGNVKLSEKLKIESRDPTVQQGINRQKSKYRERDLTIDPDQNFEKGIYKKPPLQRLKDATNVNVNEFRNKLAIGAGVTALAGEAWRTLKIIRSLGGAM